MCFVILAALPVAVPGIAQAQFAIAPSGSAAWDRITIDAFMSRHEANGLVASPLDGAGGRILFALGRSPAHGPRPMAARTALGAFGLRTDQDAFPANGAAPLRTTHVGIQTDFRWLAQPAGGRLDPLVSLGIGAFRTDERAALATPANMAEGRRRRATLVAVDGIHIMNPLVEHTNLAVSPGVGARLMLWPGMALRVDARDAIVFREGARHYLEISGGLSLGW
jgi:hypothetical protein